VIWPPDGLHSIFAVPKGEHSNSTFFIAAVIPDLQANFDSGRRRKMLKYWLAHLDNAPTHNSKRSQETLETTGATMGLHPVYRPDIAPTDFYLFRNLKEKLKSVAVTDQDSRLDVVTQLFSGTRQSEPIIVCQSWMK
jgi:hypothetical protein